MAYRTTSWKQTEIGKIPYDWDVKTLGEIGEFASGYGFPEKEQGGTSGIPFFKVSDMNLVGNEISMVTANNYVTTEQINRLRYNPIKEESIIFAKVGAAIFLERKKLAKNFLLDNNMMAFIPRKNINYFKCVFNTIKLSEYTKVGALPSYNASDLKKIIVKYPDSIEQMVIAGVLGDLDALIDGLEKLRDKKRAIKTGAMQRLLSGHHRLPPFSKPWVKKSLCEIALDIRTGKRNNEDKTEDGKYPFFVRSQQIEQINSYSCDCEAIIIPGEGNIGQIFHYINGKFDFHQRVYKISNFVNSDVKFIFYYMKMFFGEYALANTVKATVDSLRLPTFENFELTIPSDKSEQSAIAAILTDMDAEIDAITNKINKYKMIKDGAAAELLSGRIRLVKPME